MHGPIEAVGKAVAVPSARDANVPGLNTFIHAINLHDAAPS